MESQRRTLEPEEGGSMVDELHITALWCWLDTCSTNMRRETVIKVSESFTSLHQREASPIQRRLALR